MSCGGLSDTKVPGPEEQVRTQMKFLDSIVNDAKFRSSWTLSRATVKGNLGELTVPVLISQLLIDITSEKHLVFSKQFRTRHKLWLV